MIALVLLVFISLAWGEEFIVKLRDTLPGELPGNVKVLKRFKNFLLVKVTQEERALISSLSLQPNVEYVVPNIKLRSLRVPNDPYYDSQWGLELINAASAWNSVTDCGSITVAVIDTGIAYDHEDLQGNIWNNEAECKGIQGIDDDGNGFVDDCLGWDFVNEDEDPYDDEGHGTMASGIIGALGNNGKGIAGICWKISLMPLKILDINGIGSVFDFLRAVYYAVDMGAKVINTSLGTCPVGYSQCDIASSEDPALLPLEEGVRYALSKGVVIVAAAGNENLDADTYPVYPGAYSRDFPNVINVASVDQDGKLSWFSNYGKLSVDVAAPGGLDADGKGIISTSINGYDYGIGTSFASPFVAGAVAIMLSIKPDLSPGEIKEALRMSSVSLENLADKIASGGYISLERILPDMPGGAGGGCLASGAGWGFLSLLLVILARLFRLLKP